MAQPNDHRWREQALCAEVDPELFFPEVGATPQAAPRICAGCPVRTECLVDAMNRHDVTFGVRGGLTPKQRQVRLRKYQETERWSVA